MKNIDKYTEETKSMTGAKAVGLFMEMIARAKSDDEIAALRAGIRALVRRRVYRVKQRLNHKAAAEAAAIEAQEAEETAADASEARPDGPGLGMPLVSGSHETADAARLKVAEEGGRVK